MKLTLIDTVTSKPGEFQAVERQFNHTMQELRLQTLELRRFVKCIVPKDNVDAVVEQIFDALGVE